MTLTLSLNDPFPDIQLPDHNGRPRQLSALTRPAEIDRRLQLDDGYPLIVVFYRGFFCPRDQQQLRMLVDFQDELAVNFCKLVTIGIQSPIVQAAFRAGLGSSWTFLADTERKVITQLGIVDETEGEYANTALPYTFVLRPDLTIYTIYDGWYFVGRPTLEELRHDLRHIMQAASYYPHEVWTTEAVKKIRIPQSEWEGGAPPLGETGLTVASGMVSTFDFRTGNGSITIDNTGEAIFFNFTAIPGAGYRTINPQTRVRFEMVENETGRTARNIQRIED